MVLSDATIRISMGPFEGRGAPATAAARLQQEEKKMPSSGLSTGAGHKLWQRPTLAQARQALPSALWRFTSVFGMGTGGTTTQGSPDDGNLKMENLKLPGVWRPESHQRTTGTLIPQSRRSCFPQLPPPSDNRIPGQTPQLQRSESA
jgi:hypothetical protein